MRIVTSAGYSDAKSVTRNSVHRHVVVLPRHSLTSLQTFQFIPKLSFMISLFIIWIREMERNSGRFRKEVEDSIPPWNPTANHNQPQTTGETQTIDALNLHFFHYPIHYLIRCALISRFAFDLQALVAETDEIHSKGFSNFAVGSTAAQMRNL